MATKRLTNATGKSIEIRAKVRRQGTLKNLDKNHIEVGFPPDLLPPPGSTVYIHDQLILQSTEAAANKSIADLEIYFTIQEHLNGNLARAAVAKIVSGSLADLEYAFALGIRPAIGHAASDITSVKALIIHPSPSSNDNPTPDEQTDEHFIQEITCTHNERVLLSGNWGRSMAKDSYLAFEFNGGSKGDRLRLSWSDNQGNSDFAETTIK